MRAASYESPAASTADCQRQLALTQLVEAILKSGRLCRIDQFIHRYEEIYEEARQ